MPENGSQCNRRWWMGKNEMALVGYVQRCNGNDAAHRGDGIYKPRHAEAAQRHECHTGLRRTLVGLRRSQKGCTPIVPREGSVVTVGAPECEVRASG